MGELQSIGGWGLLVAAGFLLDWAAIACKWKRIKPFTKPLAMFLVMVWTALNGGQASLFLLGLLLAAQALGLLGDILLLFPEKAFSAGLAAFLTGHLFYLGLLINGLTAVFRESESSFGPFGWRPFEWRQFVWLLSGFVFWLGMMALVYRLFRHLPEQENLSRGLWLGIQAYSWILSAMVVMALIMALQSGGSFLERYALPLGALLFLISDSMLTYDRFVKSFNRAQLWVRITYHLAQFSLAWGFLMLIA